MNPVVLLPTYLTSTVNKILAFNLSFICLHTSNLTFFDQYMKNTCPVINLNTYFKTKKMEGKLLARQWWCRPLIPALRRQEDLCEF